MKRTLLALTAALLALTACDTKTVKFDELTVDIEYPYSEGSSNSLTLNADVDFPTSGFNKADLPRVCEAIRSACFGEGYKEFSGTLEELGMSWRDSWHEDYMTTNAQMLKEMEMSESDAPFLNWEITSYGSFGDFYQHYINYIIESFQYLGGAHGVNTMTPVVFDLNTGEEVPYSAFTGNVSPSQLVALLDKHKYDALENMIKEDDIDRENIFYVEKIEPSRHFTVDDDGITFYYQPYDVAAYVFGVIQIPIPWEELR